MRSTAKRAMRHQRPKRQGKRLAALTHVEGHVEKGKIRLAEPVTWGDGQRVVVIPLPESFTAKESGAPPVELLEADAKEFARRPETIVPIFRNELD
jgi:hypothetical protein